MVSVGPPLADPKEPSTTGGPSGTRWISARPPKARTLASPSSAQRSRSALRSGSADTLGISTNSLSSCSKRGLWSAANWSSLGRVKAMGVPPVRQMVAWVGRPRKARPAFTPRAARDLERLADLPGILEQDAPSFLGGQRVTLPRVSEERDHQLGCAVEDPGVLMHDDSVCRLVSRAPPRTGTIQCAVMPGAIGVPARATRTGRLDALSRRCRTQTAGCGGGRSRAGVRPRDVICRAQPSAPLR